MARASVQEIAGRDIDNVAMQNARAELVGRIAAGLAHDLNGPIGVVLGFTRLAREKLEAGESADAKGVVEYLRMIENAGENARSLARDMWDFARATPGEIGEFDFTEVMETSARLTAPSLRVASIEPPAAGELSNHTVNGDRALWAHAIVGLLMEAPATLPGGGTIEWRLAEDEEGSGLAATLVSSPNEPVGGADTSAAPAQEWKCGESTREVLRALNATLGPAAGLRGDQSGVVVKVPARYGN